MVRVVPIRERGPMRSTVCSAVVAPALVAALLLAPSVSDAERGVSQARAAVAHDQARLRGTSVVVPVRCRHVPQRRCTGMLTLHARLDGRRVVVGRRSFTVRHAVTTAVVPRLSESARRAIIRNRGRLVVTTKTVTRQPSGTSLRSVGRVALVTRARTTKRPSLQWVDLKGPATLDCRRDRLDTATYSASGTATGPYPGTFTEQGRYEEDASRDPEGDDAHRPWARLSDRESFAAGRGHDDVGVHVRQRRADRAVTLR